ncbi:MAG TPA: phenylalanine--tRNA ligase subunit beta [Actinospica sp.]|jgi:phenylalanyl-tRNA synthetase beta chain|nr:phenylalanine--tRNA ligase subunit beta [Actinospica sp.]
MKISLDWVCDYADLPEHLSSEDLARELTLKTVEVEARLETSEPLRHVVVSQIVGLDVQENGAAAALCAIGDGGEITVVTRAGNLSVGSRVAIALPGATVDGRRIEPTLIGGILSAGYLCRAADLGLDKLFPPTGPADALLLNELASEPGALLADEIPWADTILEIDNKSLTNRPDLWGHYGIARELAAIARVPLHPLCPRPAPARPSQSTGLIGTVDSRACQRLTLVEFELDGTLPSPLWLRSRLARLGEASINLPVDLANYVMFATGQPLHVYDAEKLALPVSVTLEDEPVEMDLLDGSTVHVAAPAPLVRDASVPIALAGIMGGAHSAVTRDSRRFLLEAACFRPKVIRRAALGLAVRTEAAARFEKGLDTQRVDEAIDLYLTLLALAAPLAHATRYQDHNPTPTEGAYIEVPVDFLNSRIGLVLDAKEITGTLEALGFAVDIAADTVRVIAPTWRSTGDVSIPDDVLEEVARIHGYDAIPAATLGGTFTHLSPAQIRPLDRRVREQLAARADMQEVVTYPWSAEHTLRASGLDPAAGVAFDGAPAPDRASLRPSLIPNLLEAVSRNLRHAAAFEIFEVGTVFAGGEHTRFAGHFEPMPGQGKRAAAMFVGADGPRLFLRAKGVLEMLRRHAHLTDLELAQSDGAGAEWADSALRLDLNAGGRRVGTLGLVGTRCKRLSGIDHTQVVAFEIDLDALEVQPTRENAYRAVSDLPESDFDLSVVVPIDTVWAQVEASALSAGGLVDRVGFVGEFQGGWVPSGHKSTTLRVTLRPQSTTLTAEDIAAARTSVLGALSRDIGAHLRS